MNWNFLHLSRFVLWPRIWSFLVWISYVHLKRIFILLLSVGCSRNVIRSSWLVVLFYSVTLWIFRLLFKKSFWERCFVISQYNYRLVLYLFPVASVFASCNLKFFCQVNEHLRFDEWNHVNYIMYFFIPCDFPSSEIYFVCC